MLRYHAVLLIGPSGSGKTPFGDLCQRNGLWGFKCFHFDFGQNLRRITLENPFPAYLTIHEVAVIRNSLDTGSLLENEHFHIARIVLEDFINTQKVMLNDRLILNGLPRHIGQARNMDDLVVIERIVYLECCAEIIRKRIFYNTGGDRDGRVDDSLVQLENRLAIFHDRTAPVIDHYQRKGVKVHRIAVSEKTLPEEIMDALGVYYPI